MTKKLLRLLPARGATKVHMQFGLVANVDRVVSLDANSYLALGSCAQGNTMGILLHCMIRSDNVVGNSYIACYISSVSTFRSAEPTYSSSEW
jgi:hypothetical protein